MLFNNKYLNLLNTLSRTYHDSRGSHYGESILTHILDMRDKASSDGQKDRILLDLIELHDIGKPSTITIEDKKIMFKGHEKTSATMARAMLNDTGKYDSYTKNWMTKVIYYHMKMNDIRYEFNFKRLAKLYIKLDCNSVAMDYLRLLSFYDLKIYNKDVNDELMRNNMLLLFERHNNFYEIELHKMDVPDKVFKLVELRVLHNVLCGMSKSDIEERVKNDVSNYVKFTPEKLDEIINQNF